VGNKKVIIHSGFHKTASSSIQHSLAGNRSLLAEYGYHYPDIKFNGNDRFYNQSVPLYGLYTSHPEKFKHYWYHNNLDHTETNKKIWELFESELWDHEKLVFSDEFFSRLNEQQLQKVKQDFEEHGFEVVVVSYVREPYNLMNSVAQQQAKSGTIGNALLSDRPAAEVDKIRRLRKVFGHNAEFYNFEKACQHKFGPAGFFFELLGVEQEEDRTIKVNEGISMQAVRLSDYINSACPLFMSGSEINPLRNKLDLRHIFLIKGDKFSLNAEESKLIEPQVSKAREEIAELLGPDFLPSVKVKQASNNETWNSKQLQDLLEITPQLDLNLLLRVHDYFFELKQKTDEFDFPEIKQLQ
jgi:hypothetical protein